DWPTARLAQRSLEEEVRALRLQAGNPVYVGSPGLIRSLTEFGLIDEYQLCVHPVIAGSGLQLFGTLNRRVELILIGTKAFNSGAVILCLTRTNYINGGVVGINFSTARWCFFTAGSRTHTISTRPV